MRWLHVGALACQVLVIAAADWLYAGRLALTPLLVVTGCYALWTGLFFVRTAGGAELGRNHLMFEIVVDLLVLTALFYVAGGWTNPFVTVYLIPVALAALMLAPQPAIAIAALALTLYALIVRFQMPLPNAPERFGSDFNLHVLGMWLSFVIGTIVLVASVALLRQLLEQQRAALARERESRLRDEQLVALGALAATTAHELGTPLTTARLIADEFEECADVAARARAEALGQQLDYAIEKLRALVGVATGASAYDTASPAELLRRIADRFAILRPETVLEQRFEALPAFRLGDTRLLEGALLALLVNAATASDAAGESRVMLWADVDGESFQIRIRDFGSGMPLQLAGGRAVVGSRSGFGVGLTISSATIERYDGVVEYVPHDPGTELRVTLPLRQLTASP